MPGRGSAISRKRKTGVQWYAVYDGPPKADGSRNQVWEAAVPNNRATARRLATMRIAQLHRGEWEHPREPVYFHDLADRWLEKDAKPRLAANSIEAYETWLTNHLVPYFGDRDSRFLKSEDLQGFVAEKLGAGLAVGYVKSLVGLLKTILRQGVEWGHLRPGAAEMRVRYPRHQKDEVDPFTPTEIRALIAASRPRWRPMLIMAVWSGMRQSELLASRWKHLDREKGQYLVKESLTRKMVFGPTKGAAAAPVDLSPYVFEALEEQKARVAEWRLAGVDWQDHDLIFPNAATGKPWTQSYVRKVFIDTCERAKVRYRPPHNLRHTCASLMIHQGDSIKAVQSQLRHASPRLALDTYIHLMPNVRREAIHRLDATIFGVNDCLTEIDQQG